MEPEVSQTSREGNVTPNHVLSIDSFDRQRLIRGEKLFPKNSSRKCISGENQQNFQPSMDFGMNLQDSSSDLDDYCNEMLDFLLSNRVPSLDDKAVTSQSLLRDAQILSVSPSLSTDPTNKRSVNTNLYIQENSRFPAIDRSKYGTCSSDFESSRNCARFEYLSRFCNRKGSESIDQGRSGTEIEASLKPSEKNFSAERIVGTSSHGVSYGATMGMPQFKESQKQQMSLELRNRSPIPNSSQIRFNTPISMMSCISGQPLCDNPYEQLSNLNGTILQKRKISDSKSALPVEPFSYPFSLTADPVVSSKSFKSASLEAGVGNDLGESNDEKKKQRLAKNRESARQSRQRKKQYLELLEDKVSQLIQELESLRSKRLNESNSELLRMRDMLLQSLQNQLDLMKHVDEVAAEKELSHGVKELLCHLGSFSDKRLAIMAYHFDRLQSLILPSYSRLILWLSYQPEEFFSSSNGKGSGNRSGMSPDSTLQPLEISCGGNENDSRSSANEASSDIWKLMCKELGLTADQQSKFKMAQKELALDPAVVQSRKSSLKMMMLLGDLQESIEKFMEHSQVQAQSILSSVCPSHIIRYMSWANGNKDAITAHCNNSVRQALREDSNDADTKRNGAECAPSFTTSGEPTSAKILRLLETPDNELTNDDLIWLMEWVKQNQARRRGSSSCSKLSFHGKNLLQSASQAAGEFCDLMKSNYESANSLQLQESVANVEMGKEDFDATLFLNQFHKENSLEREVETTSELRNTSILSEL